jgi:hypothetical protein
MYVMQTDAVHRIEAAGLLDGQSAQTSSQFTPRNFSDCSISISPLSTF